MKNKKLIFKGDTTDHGGIVIEGLSTYTLHGREVACKTHQVSCPLCRGVFPIIEGIPGMVVDKGLPYHPAIEGMKTACGATLIASASTTLTAKE